MCLENSGCFYLISNDQVDAVTEIKHQQLLPETTKNNHLTPSFHLRFLNL